MRHTIKSKTLTYSEIEDALVFIIRQAEINEELDSSFDTINQLLRYLSENENKTVTK